MSQNPYYPSGPDYGYGGQPGGYGAGAPGPVQRPQPLTVAVWLMYAGAAISLLSTLSTFVMLDDIREEAERQVEADNLDIDPDTIVNIGVAIGVGVGLLAVGLWVWMAVMNGRGRSWARIVATVLGALSLCSVTASFSQPASVVTVVASLVNIVLAAVILVLLWQRSSSEYYRAQSTRR